MAAAELSLAKDWLRSDTGRRYLIGVMTVQLAAPIHFSCLAPHRQS